MKMSRYYLKQPTSIEGLRECLTAKFQPISWKWYSDTIHHLADLWIFYASSDDRDDGPAIIADDDPELKSLLLTWEWAQRFRRAGLLAE